MRTTITMAKNAPTKYTIFRATFADTRSAVSVAEGADNGVSRATGCFGSAYGSLSAQWVQ